MYQDAMKSGFEMKEKKEIRREILYIHGCKRRRIGA